jgi:regulator of replication initiation timing
MDIGSITAAAEGIKYARSAFSFLLKQKIEEEAKEKVNEAMAKLGEIQDTLFQLRADNFSLQRDNEELRRALAEHQNWEKKASRYELMKTDGGAMVYSFKGDPHHYACPRCWSSKKEIHILQDSNNVYTGHYECVECGSKFSVRRRREGPDQGGDWSPSPFT